MFVQKDEVYLSLVLEYVPETVYRVARHYTKNKQIIPYLYIKVRFLQNFIFYNSFGKNRFHILTKM